MSHVEMEGKKDEAEGIASATALRESHDWHVAGTRKRQKMVHRAAGGIAMDLTVQGFVAFGKDFGV